MKLQKIKKKEVTNEEDIFFLLAIFLLFSNCVLAEEQLKENTQLVEVENAGAVLLIQKQPIYEKQMQVIRVKKSGAITVIQVNGKVKENDTNSK